MEAIKYFVTFINLIIAALLVWYALKEAYEKVDKFMSASFSILSVINVALIWFGR